MSDYKVPLTTIKDVRPHPNADRLDIATVYGYDVICGKDQYKAGDPVIYVPIDSLLPQDIEDVLFPPDGKIKLTKHRIRQIRIRKFPSQGLLISPTTVLEIKGWTPNKLEHDYAATLGITKCEPPIVQVPGQPKKKIKRKENTNFHKYSGLNNYKWYPELFKPGETVVIQEKIHGSNSRAGWVPTQANSLWRKFLKLVGLLPEFEFCYGSNNQQLQQRDGSKSFYGDDVWGQAIREAGLWSKLAKNEVVYGEVYGPGIQKNYDYGATRPTFRAFDVLVNGQYLDPIAAQQWCRDRNIPFVPTLYCGPWDPLSAEAWLDKPSTLWPKHKVAEGIVIKSYVKYDQGCRSKRALKWISPKYLDDKTNTDNH